MCGCDVECGGVMGSVWLCCVVALCRGVLWRVVACCGVVWRDVTGLGALCVGVV